MLHFRMNMPFYLMAFYGSIMIILILLLRSVLKNKLPKFVFPILWASVLIRLLIPFSLSSPISMKVPDISLPHFYEESTAPALESSVVPDLLSGTYDFSNELAVQDNIAVVEEGVNTAYTSNDIYRSRYVFPSWRNVLLTVYLLGLVITTGTLFFQKYRYSDKLKNRLLVEHNETINSLLRSLHMGHILVFTNDEIASPMVCGLLNPRIYLPTRMDFQNTALLRDILTHETVHIRHRDNWLKTAMVIALCLNWYNPLVWIMSKCLASDLETACDAAVLRQYDDEQRKSYAFNLLSMAITGNRTTLLYSAFSKTEIEKRIKSILSYKKASLFGLVFSILFLMSSTIVFATGGQAPFSSYLSSHCSSSNCRFGVKAEITRDIALGEDYDKRSDNVILSILSADTSNDPEIIGARIKTALAKEFGVEQSAFHLDISLCLDEETREQEYASWGITRNASGFHNYQGEAVRTFRDEALGFYQSGEEGSVDLSVQRDRLGQITSVTALHEGDQDYDKRTLDIERDRLYHSGISQSLNQQPLTTAIYQSTPR